MAWIPLETSDRCESLRTSFFSTLSLDAVHSTLDHFFSSVAANLMIVCARAFVWIVITPSERTTLLASKRLVSPTPSRVRTPITTTALSSTLETLAALFFAAIPTTRSRQPTAGSSPHRQLDLDPRMETCSTSSQPDRPLRPAGATLCFKNEVEMNQPKKRRSETEREPFYFLVRTYKLCLRLYD